LAKIWSRDKLKGRGVSPIKRGTLQNFVGGGIRGKNRGLLKKGEQGPKGEKN